MEIGGISGFSELECILRLLETKGTKSISEVGGIKFSLDKAEISALGERLLADATERAAIEELLRKLPSVRESKLKEVEKKLQEDFYSSLRVKDEVADILSYIL